MMYIFIDHTTFILLFLYCSLLLTSATISPCARWNTTGVTVVGTGIKGNSSDQFDGPEAIFIYKPLNRLYVADFNNRRIQMFSLNPLSKIGVTVASNVVFPSNIYVDDDGNAEPTVYAALYQSDRVDKWVDGSMESVQVGGECRSCSGVTLDNEKNVYMTETGRHRVLKWTRQTGSITTVAGQTDQPGSMSNQLHTPQGIYIDRIHDVLYVADSKNNRVQKWSKDAQDGVTVAGSKSGIVGNDTASFSDPISIIMDAETNILYVSDFNNRRIQRWLPNATEGETIMEGSEHASVIHHFYHPTDIAFDSQGNLYVCDNFNDQVVMFSIDNRSCITPSTASLLWAKATIFIIVYSIFTWIMPILYFDIIY